MNGPRARHFVLAAVLACLPAAGQAVGQSIQLVPQSPVIELANGTGIERNLLAFTVTLQLELTSEVALCLTMGADSVIRGFRAPTAIYRDSIGIRFACSIPDMVGFAHTHPPEHGECDFSPRDKAAFERSNKEISLLACGHGELRYMVRGIHEVIPLSF